MSSQCFLQLSPDIDREWLHTCYSKSGVRTGATVFAEENTSLFDYVHDNNFCSVVSLLVLFFGMLVINIVSLIFK